MFVKVGIFVVDIEGVCKNVEIEILDWDFDGVCKDVCKVWNEMLLKIDIIINDKNDKIIFYIVFYYIVISLNLFMDVDGCYLGMDL